MSKQAADHHRKASEQFSHTSKHHQEAAKHHDAGNYEKAAHHAQRRKDIRIKPLSTPEKRPGACRDTRFQ